MAADSARRRASVWELAPELNAMQGALGHIFRFRFTLYDDGGLYRKCCHIPLDMRSSVLKNPTYSTKPVVLLAMKCSRTSLSVWRLTIQHAGALNEECLSQNFEDKSVAGLYYGSQAYAKLVRELLSNKQCEEENMKAAAESFRKLTTELNKKVSGSKRQHYSVWAASALFCAMWYINDS